MTFIQTEETPNPATLKFLPGREIMGAGSIEFRTKEAARSSPLAYALFDIDGIESVFFGADFISVTKNNIMPWSLLTADIVSTITDYFLKGMPLFCDKESIVQEKKVFDDPIAQQIQELIETRVRPAVAMDGGDIVLENFQEGIVYLTLKGSCSGCPSSSMTLKSGIERMLKHYIPEIIEVRAV